VEKKKLADLEITEKIFTPLTNENTFWYLYENYYKIYKELYEEGKIKKPTARGEWIKDLV
jgi:hypothetical protein